MFNEQRQTQRKVLKTKVLIAPEGLETIIARTVDISSSGMCVSVSGPLTIGVASQLRFDLLINGKPYTIQLQSKVKYSILSGNEFKTGFQFLNVDLASMTTIAKFLR